MAPEVRETLRRLAGDSKAVLLPALSGAPLGYRLRAKLALRGRAKSPKIGIFQENSHDLADIPRCPVHHPLINETAAILRSVVRSTGVPPFHESSRRGLLRYVQIAVHRPTQTVQVVLVAYCQDAEDLKPLAHEFIRRMDSQLHSLWFNANLQENNAIFGPEFILLHGEKELIENIAGADVVYPPGAFGQANLDLAEVMVKEIHGWIPRGSRIIEFHAGVGATGLGLLQRGDHVSFNEAAPASLNGLQAGLLRLPTELSSNAVVLAGDADSFSGDLDQFDAAIVDPPRKGLGNRLVNALKNAPLRQLIYVACGFESFVREARQIADSGAFRLREIRPVHLFPQTNHIEILAHFVHDG